MCIRDRRLLNRYPEMQVETVPGDAHFAPGRPDWTENGHPSLAQTFRLFPHRLDGEGHFAAVLRKTDGETGRAPVLAQCLPDKKIPGEYRTFESENLRVKFKNLTLCGDQLWAVSYTHLDVYKRQRGKRSNAQKAGRRLFREKAVML